MPNPMSGPIPNRKVVILPLVTKFTVQTDRTTSYSNLVVELPEAEEWGPYLSSLRILSVTKNATANINWKVSLAWTNDGMNISSSTVDLTSGITADGQTIHSAVTSGFEGRIIKFAIASKNVSGAAVESAVVWAWVIFTFQS